MKKAWIALFLCFCLFLCGCGNNGEAELDPNAPKGSVNISILTPDSLHPLSTHYQTNLSNLSILFDTLVTVEDDLSIQPAIARAWTFTDGGNSCLFTLADNITFHDGSSLTAYDVVDCLDKIMENADCSYHRLADYVASYEAVNSRQFTVDLSVPGTCFLAYMDFPIVKKGTEYVGSGPYQIISKDDNGLTAQAYLGNGHTPKIETVHILYYPRLETMKYGFTSYETDAISVSIDELSAVSDRTNANATEYVSDSFLFLGLNTGSYLFSDVNLRKAVAYAIDKEDFVKNAMANHGVAASSPYKPGTIYSDLFPSDYTVDENQINSCLKEAGYEASHLEFSILVNEEDSTKIQAAEYICKQLNTYGIPAYVRQYPFETYLEYIETGNYLAFIGEINMEQDYNLNFLLHSSENYFQFANAELDEALSQFVTTTDQTVKTDQAKKIQQILYENLPLISLCYQTNILLTDQKIQGEFTPSQSKPFYGIENWSVTSPSPTVQP